MPLSNYRLKVGDRIIYREKRTGEIIDIYRGKWYKKRPILILWDGSFNPSRVSLGFIRPILPDDVSDGRVRLERTPVDMARPDEDPIEAMRLEEV